MVREVKARMLSRDLGFVNSVDRKWKINQLVFADDMTLIADLAEELYQLVEEFGRVYRRRN